MLRRNMLTAAAVLLTAAASVAPAQYPYRGGPIYGGPIYGGGPSLFTGAYAPPYYPYPLTGAGFGAAYIGGIPYGGNGGTISAPAPGVYYPYAFSNGVVYPGGQPYVTPTPQPKPSPGEGTASTAEPPIPPVISSGTGLAHFSVKLPADAKLLVNDVETKASGSVRRFHTPATLEAGKSYEYTFRAQWMENAQPVTRDRTVRFKPGDDLTVDLTEATAR